MAKIPFDIKYRPQIESGKYKVETRVGRPVEIVKWDIRSPLDRTPILAIIRGDYDYIHAYSNNGYSIYDSDRLFVVTPEEEMTEFEKAIKRAFICAGWDSVSNGIIKDTAAELLELAKDEIYSHESLVEYAEKSRAEGKAEDLKDLPRWKKIGRGNNYSSETKFTINGRYLEMNDTLNDVYEVSLSELEKLPRFKED